MPTECVQRVLEVQALSRSRPRRSTVSETGKPARPWLQPVGHSSARWLGCRARGFDGQTCKRAEHLTPKRFLGKSVIWRLHARTGCSLQQTTQGRCDPICGLIAAADRINTRTDDQS